MKTITNIKNETLSKTIGFPKIQSAGGLIYNKNNNILLMLKQAKWDMPKGRVEANDTKETTAYREVSEETGLNFKKLAIEGKLVSTWHTTYHDTLPFLKKTHWFMMRYNGGDDVTKPQLEEGITECRWVSAGNLANYTKNMRPRIHYVIDFWQRNLIS